MPAQMQSAQDLFAYELSCMYVFEQQNVQTLQQLSQEVTSDEARRPIDHHLEETREQVTLLEQCFQALGQSPQRVTVHIAQGLKQDHDAFVKVGPTPELLTLYDLGAAAKTEHLEVAAYRGLVSKASLMGQKEVTRLLREILKQEEDAVQELEAAAKQLARQAIPQPSTA